MSSVLELENALGGDPGPGLGADSDFDKKQLEKVILLFGQIDGCDKHKWQASQLEEVGFSQVESGLHIVHCAMHNSFLLYLQFR